jgi:prepilin-type processing-associated H-X9-DG protein
MWPANEGAENWTGYPATRHGRAGPVSFADGHVEVRKWVEASTIPNLRRLETDMQFLVPGSRDFRWLHDRTRVYGDHGPQGVSWVGNRSREGGYLAHAKNRPSTERVFCSNEPAVLNACAG